MGPSWPLSQLPAARWRSGCLLPHPPKTPSPCKGEGKLEPQTLILCWDGPNLPIWGEHILALASSLHHFNGRKRPGFCLGKG